MTKQSLTTSTAIKPFEFQLPAELDVAPRFTVRVAKNWTAYVYDEKYDHVYRDINNQSTTEPRDGFRIDVRHDVSGKSQTSNYYGRGGIILHSLLDVKLHLQDVVVELAPKTRTTTQRDEED